MSATSRQYPSLAVIALAGAGLLLGAVLDWKPGAFVLSGAMLLAGTLRLSLPERQAGWLAVRSRPVDAAVLLTLGFALAALANTIPDV